MRGEEKNERWRGKKSADANSSLAEEQQLS